MNQFFAAFLFFQESARGLINAPGETAVEPTIINIVSWLRLFIEMTGAAIIAVGVVLAVYRIFLVLITRDSVDFIKVRLHLARYLALALEFQLGADILSTAIAPTWNQIGKLGAIAVIRTALNYFLSHEMERERRLTKTEDKIEKNFGD